MMPELQSLHVGQFIDYVPKCPNATSIDPQEWFLVRVHPNREMKVEDRFAKRGITAYLPKETKSQRTVWHKRRVIELPIFWGLIFVASFHQNLDQLKAAADDVSGYLSFGDKRAKTNAATMLRIRKLEERLKLPLGQRKFEVGQAVRVAEGPFASDMWTGRILRLDRHGRLKVLLSTIERQVSVYLDETQIEPV